ncbi:SRPBCC family protein [Streptomyces sp. WM6378]|uniref:SRPBCC family protein n=1 Tax=Streptomyces sp. WM6378 TaxID=1415557 RepID=UPI0006AF9814|nr:SRPBCC domain-containing protein [Streptomyces sp. WM6378]KOU37049.1 ATPase [Streptomyces sp. WM6378]
MSENVNDGIEITRVFDAPRDLVFRAWTTPEHFAAWYGGAAEVPLDRISLDVRPGGAWSLVMLVPGHGEMPFGGVYKEVVEPERLVFTLKDASAPADIEGEIVTVTFADHGDKTEMVFTQRGGNLTAEQYEQARGGWAHFFDTLAGHLAQR